MIIDVEGYEKQVLKGMDKLLSDIKSADIVIEIFEGSPQKQEITEFMASKGFKAKQIEKDNWLFQK